MKTFGQLLKEEQDKEHHHVLAFGRMNPPTTGHMKLIDKVKGIAQKVGGKHTIVVSHSQDTKKNPLSGEQKIKHLKRYSPGTNFKASSKEHPTLMHHAAELHKQGVTHLHVVGGSDRVKEYHDLLHKYNGVKAGHGHYNFKKITVHSAGHRDPDAEGTEGMSASKMREHAKNKDFSSFRHGVPHHVSDQHAKELMHDVRKGMGLHESYNRGLFKAIFVTGGPGSGKDIILRESIPESRAVELNPTQAFDYLMDKQKLSEKTSDYRREAIRNRGPLIINGPADDYNKIVTIREELEELGYETLMVFVDTTNETSKIRNQNLTKMISESVRLDKWKKAQACKESYQKIFENFIDFDNSSNLELIEEDITETYRKINSFIEGKDYSEIAFSWLGNNGKLKEDENVTKNSKSIQAKTIRKYNPGFRTETSIGHSKVHTGSKPTFSRTGQRAADLGSISADNRASEPASGDINWNRNAKRGSFIFRTYTEAKEASLTKNPEPKESNFSKDKEKGKIKKGFKDSATVNQRMRNVSGIGPEFDTRQQGTVYPMSGLGDVTYREEKQPKTFGRFMKEYKGFQNDDEGMGVGGVLGGASNKEPMQSYKDLDKNIIDDPKKKKNKK